MTAQIEPEIILYDLACTQGICFSPVVWRIRLMLNYKQIPYKTIFLEFPDIEPTLKELYVIQTVPSYLRLSASSLHPPIYSIFFFQFFPV